MPILISSLEKVGPRLALLQAPRSVSPSKKRRTKADTENVTITHIQVSMAQQGRRRTYRAHGRISAYMNCPSHVEILLEEKESVSVSTMPL